MEIPEEGETDSTLAEAQEIEEIEPISDTEEDKEELTHSVRVGKRQKSDLSDIEGKNEEDDRLPIIQSQIRESGRARKRPKGLEGYEIMVR